MSFNENGWWKQEMYYALVAHDVYSSHSEVHAIFSSKELAEAKQAEFEKECNEKGMGIFSVEWGVEEFKLDRGYLCKGQKHEKIAVVNNVPSVAEFAFYPGHSVEMNMFEIDECKPLEFDSVKIG